MIKKIIQSYKLKRNILKKNNLNKPIKLNLACGTDYKEGWINIDNNSDNNIQKIDIFWDLRDKLPIKDNTVDFIYNEHFLEHLTVDESRNLLKEFYRILKPNGVMRIAMPDLSIPINRYFNPKWKNDPVFKKYGLEHIQTRAEMINISFREWGHKWLYDSEELHRRLNETGWVKIKDCKNKESTHKELKNLESREESTLIVETIK